MDQSTISFKSKILDFGSIFNIINQKDEITVYSELGKKTYIVKSKNIDKIELISIDNIHEITVWEKEQFINNYYNIFDIVLTGDFLFDITSQKFNVSTTELTENLIGFETYYMEINDWEKIFPIDEQRDDIFQSLIKDIPSPSINLIAKMKRKSNSFIDLIELYQKRDFLTNEFIQDARKTSNEIPELDFLKLHNFKSNIIFPILNDAKYIYHYSSLFLEEDEPRKIFYQTEENNDSYDIVQLSQLEEINILYSGFKSSTTTPNRLSFKDAKQIEYLGGKLPEIVSRYKKEILPTEVLPIYTAYKSMKYNNYYEFTADNSFFAYRNITPNYPFELPGQKNILFQNRYVRGVLYHLEDNPDLTNINKNPNCLVCHGTPKTGEHIYHSENDPYVKPGKSFNLSISKEPSSVPYLKGEDVILTGFLVRSPYYINPDFNSINKKHFHLQKYILEHYGGYLNIIERYLYNKNRPLNEIFSNNIEYNGTKIEDIDYKKDNFIIFNQNSDNKYSKEDYYNILQNIVLDQNKVLQIESDNIKQINNFTELNKILSNYYLNIKNLNQYNFEKIKQILEKRYELFKQSSIIEKENNRYYKKLNNSLDSSLSNLYQTLFTIDSNEQIDLTVITKLIKHMFKKEDKNVIQHLLKYYFFIETNFISLEDAIVLLSKCIYERYYDYLCTETAYRLIFHPTYTIKNIEISTIIDNIVSFYDIEQISLHRPTKIGVLNELIHLLNIKDKGIQFDILIQYLHTLNALTKLEHESIAWNNQYKSIDEINELIRNDEDEIKKVMSEHHSKCMKFRLSKIYLSLNVLENDNNKENLVYDDYLDISNNLKSMYKKIKSKIESSDIQYLKKELKKNMISIYPFEIDRWVEDKIENLVRLDGNIDKNIVEENDWALLIDNDLDFYRLYKRINNIWIFNNSVPENERIAPIIDKKKYFIVNSTKNNFNFSSLCHLEGSSLPNIENMDKTIDVLLNDNTNTEIGKKCVIHNGFCVSKIVADIDNRLQYYKHALKSKKYLEEQQNNLYDLLLNLQPKILNLEKKIKDIKEKRFQQIFQITQTTETKVKEVSYNEKLLKQYKDQFNLIKNISDDDMRLTEMEKYISLHGLFDRNIKDGKLIRVPVEEANFIYWDIPNIVEKMCCKHWLLLTKQAYKISSERAKLQKQLELDWGEELPNSRYIYCKNCDMVIGLSLESDNEGFDAEDRLIQIREAIQETSINEILNSIEIETTENLSNISKSSDNIDIKILKDITTDPDIHIPYSDMKEILQNVQEFINKDNLLDVYQFEAEFISKNETNIVKLQSLFKQGTEGKLIIEKYRELRNKYLPISKGKLITKLLIDNLTQDIKQPAQALKKQPTQTSDDSDLKSKQQFLALYNRIKDAYEPEYNFKLIIYIAARLITSIIIAEPEYKILGSSERSTGQAIYSNFILRGDLAIKMINEKIYNLFKSETDIYKTSNNYLSTISQLTKQATKDYLYEQLEKMCINYNSIPTIANKKKEKLIRVTKNRQQAIDNIKNSIDWITFRPYLKITSNLQEQIDNLNSQIVSIENTLQKGQKIKDKYYSYLLSNNLFYSIQNIIQKTEPMIKNSFTNFCCLTNPRNYYMSHFIDNDNNILHILTQMKNIQSNVFYHPNQNLFLLYGDKMNIETPNLLDYLNKDSPLLNKDEVTKRIKKLITNYTLLEDEGNILGKRRLFSSYYDKYLKDITKINKSDLLQKMKDDNPHISTISIELRHKNLYSNKAGLILHDRVSNKYIWEIENEISELLLEKNIAQCLEIYYNLLINLYQTSKLYISNKVILRIPFDFENSNVLQQFLEQQQVLSNTFQNIQKNIYDNFESDKSLNDSGFTTFEEYNENFYSSFNKSVQKFKELGNKLNTIFASEIANRHNNILELVTNKTVENYETGLVIENQRIRNNLIEMNAKAYKDIWKELLEDIPKITQILNKELKTIHEEKCWINNILTQNEHKNILKEIREKIPNQILIEGYLSSDLKVESDIRNKYIDNKYRFRKLDTIKRYFYIIHNQISKFKYFKMDCVYNIVNRKKNINKNLHKNTELDLELNSYNIKNFFSNDLYESIDKNNIYTPIDSNLIFSLLSLETHNMHVESIRSTTTDYIYLVVSYFSLVELWKFMSQSINRSYYADFCYEFIWKNNIEKLEILNMMTEKQVKTHLRNILANENKSRLAKFKELSESKKIIHKLKRDLGLGNLSVPDDDTDGNAIQDEIDLINESEENYLQNEYSEQDKQRSINVRVDLLVGDDADEAQRQIVSDLIIENDIEENAADIEFGILGVRGDNDDEFNDEFLDD